MKESWDDEDEVSDEIDDEVFDDYIQNSELLRESEVRVEPPTLGDCILQN